MNSNTRISHPTIFTITQWKAPGKARVESGEILDWSSVETETPGLLTCIASFDETIAFNCLLLEKEPDFKHFFPNTFRFEVSTDGKVWESILQESNFSSGSREPRWHFPLIYAKHIKLLILNDRKTDNGNFFSAFKKFSISISGLVSIETSSEIDRLWVKENLIDGRPDYGWSSAISKHIQNEFLMMDMGSVNEVNEIRILSSNENIPLFPERFSFSYSEDNISWHHLIEENAFLAEKQTWYKWSFVPINMRFLRIDIPEGARNRDGKYVSQFIEVELFASVGAMFGQNNAVSSQVMHASALRAGISRLAMNGEDREGVVVQGNDQRLKIAQEGRPGIVELASNGEASSAKVVVANDRRLRDATEDLPGIVRLARNGEERQNHVVQGNDDRLKYATHEKAGLVELATDGEVKAEVVVQGNDNRLKYATQDRAGIVQLAKNTSANPGEVVQGDDYRLRKASTESIGIMQFASHKNNSALHAVQADDPRLSNASPENFGIVKIARDAESKPGSVVESIDSRLQKASSEKAGIVHLAPHGSNLSGHVVQASDPRLIDKRHPLDHKHDYADKSHGFDEHEGVLYIKKELGNDSQYFSEASYDSAPIVGENKGKGSGLVGKGSDGVIGTGVVAGVLGMNTAQGVGVQGLARHSAGGHFVSEKDYALVAGGNDELRKIDSSDKAILAKGQSCFRDSVFLQNSSSADICMGIYYPVSKKDVLSFGDLVVIRDDGQKLNKNKNYGSTCVIGVVAKKASLVFSSKKIGPGFNPDLLIKPEGMELIAISGIVEMNVHVEKGRAIEAGDLLVASSKPGFAEKMNPDKCKPGMIIGRSFMELKSGEAKLLVQLFTS